MDEVMTTEEVQVVTDLGTIYNKIRKIIYSGNSDELLVESDIREVMFHIHALQNMIMSQAAARAYPDHFRLLGHRGK